MDGGAVGSTGKVMSPLMGVIENALTVLMQPVQQNKSTVLSQNHGVYESCRILPLVGFARTSRGIPRPLIHLTYSTRTLGTS